MCRTTETETETESEAETGFVSMIDLHPTNAGSAP